LNDANITVYSDDPVSGYAPIAHNTATVFSFQPGNVTLSANGTYGGVYQEVDSGGITKIFPHGKKRQSRGTRFFCRL